MTCAFVPALLHRALHFVTRSPILVHMGATGPRAFVAAPAPLLAALRCEAGRQTSKAFTPCVTWIHSTINRRKSHHHEHGALVSAAAAAAASPSRASAAPVQSSSAIDPTSLVGFTVLDMTRKNRVIGVVEDVLTIAETGQAQPLLHVCGPTEAPQLKGEDNGDGIPREEHLIPYVPEIVPSIDTSAGVLYAQPPPGLLELGRQHQLLATLERDLEPFTHPPPLSLLSRMGLRLMPTSAQLLAAGQRDLVLAIKRAGGFLEVAQALGLRSQRKPAGFWHDEANLDEELTLFVAAHWTKFQDPESRQAYWYNQITHRISWEEPVLPERVEIDDEGGYILTEAEEDRVMPSLNAVCAAGRYDLHHAILHHGGYTAASKLLGRRSAWPPYQHLNSLPALRRELRDFVRETELPPSRMPTVNQLVDAGRGDLLQAIVQRGGFGATAAALGWVTQRRRRRAWVDEAAVAAELRSFILQAQFPAEVSREGSKRHGGGSRLPQQTPQREEQHAGDLPAREEQAQREPEQQGRQEAAGAGALPPLPAGARMPTHRELASAGRHDLRYALQQHGSARLASLLGLQLSRRGAHNRRLRAAGPAPEEVSSPS